MEEVADKDSLNNQRVADHTLVGEHDKEAGLGSKLVHNQPFRQGERTFQAEAYRLE